MEPPSGWSHVASHSVSTVAGGGESAEGEVAGVSYQLSGPGPLRGRWGRRANVAWGHKWAGGVQEVARFRSTVYAMRRLY